MKVKIFVSWSGPRSKAIALALCHWLPRVHHSLEPWMSPSISKGKRWQTSVNTKLESIDAGIICLTPENRTAPWILFEAGALSKKLHSTVCPVIYELEPGEIDAPLSQFQVTELNKEDVTKLILSLNELLSPEDQADTAILIESVKNLWQKLQVKMKKIGQMEICLPDQSIAETIAAMSSQGLVEPACSSQAFFNKGYETHQLYSLSSHSF